MASSNKMKNLLRDYDKINFMCIQSVLESQKQYYLQMMEYIYPKKSSFEF
jgi:hypothetical protein